MTNRWTWALVVGLGGCVEGPKFGGEDDAEQVEQESSGAPDAESSSGAADPSDASTTEDPADDESSTTCGFICVDPDIDEECDVWAQDCPTGEKCAPWVNDGGAAWNALKCVPVDADPGQPGDSCFAEGGGGSGIDDCALGSMCWDVNEKGVGTCVSFCEGSADNPSCSDATATCVIANDGVLNVCLPICDPLLQDCTEGQACYPIGDSFACGPDVSAEAGLFGDPCEAINVCDPGLFCASPALVPDCVGSSGCCSSFCDLDEGNNCQGAGQECVAWFDEGQAPPGAETLGACIIPE